MNSFKILKSVAQHTIDGREDGWTIPTNNEPNEIQTIVNTNSFYL